MRIIMLIVIFVLTGCEIPVDNAIVAKRIAARHALFNECMELAAKMPRQADDDVSDIVEECSTQAYYMTNAIK